MIPVTKTFLPPIHAYFSQVQRAFDNGWLTNRGELVLELESKITHFLKLNETKIICMSNGTLPLQIALKILGNGGEIITTPFSYVATTAAIVWEGCTPVFVDIHPEYLTIDETKIEESITDKTTCILATHVFGNPCNVEEIDRIAKKYNLKVIYDAAHCFGVNYKGKSIFEYGDLSTCSFHATKVFHTGEGGAIFCKDEEIFHKIFYSHNFGHNGPYDFFGVGINGKMSELHAAMGLVNLNYFISILENRKSTVRYYQDNIHLDNYHHIKIREFTDWNYSYFPIILKDKNKMESLVSIFKQDEIYPRRYFYPSLNNLNYIESPKMDMSDTISESILCLPLYFDIDKIDLKKIIAVLNVI
jgi:dTDP-4-amino-4,6-dideoxygalactose transaminase